MGQGEMVKSEVKTRPTFGEELRRLRKERGWTQAELAERAGLTRQTISYLERDHVAPQFDTLERLLAALGITGADILTNDSLQSEPIRRLRQLLETMGVGLMRLSSRVRERLPEVGRIVRKARERAGLSQAELAERCDLTQTDIANFERGNFSGWSLTKVKRVADEFGILEEVENTLLNGGAEI